MKKAYAVLMALMMMFSMNMVAFAAPSPTGTAIAQDGAEKSPKTGDLNILYVELAGAALAVTAAVAAKKSRKEA